MSPQKTRPDDSFLNFPVNTSMSPKHGDVLTYSTGTTQWTNGSGTSGLLDDRYLRLDASNDPVTGLLTIIPSTNNTEGLNVQTMGDTPSFEVTQRATGSSVNAAVFNLLREPSGNSAPSFTDPIMYLNQSRGSSGTMSGDMLRYDSDGNTRIQISPNIQGTGTLVSFDGDFTLSPGGMLLLLKNHTTPRFYVNASGTAYSNDVSLIKEASTDGKYYGRKNAGWEAVTPDNGWLPQIGITWTRTGNHSFTLSGNLTGTYQKGTKVWYTDSGIGNKYGVVGSFSLTGTTTFVNLIPNTDYIASGTIANPYISYIENPVGWQKYFNYQPVYSASASMTYTSVSTSIATWTTRGNTIFVRLIADGTTGGTASITLFATAPITELSNGVGVIQPGSYAEGGAGLLGYSFVFTGLIGVRKADASNYGLGAGRTMNANVNYEF